MKTPHSINSSTTATSNPPFAGWGWWFGSALVFFLLASLLGTTMRFAWVVELPFVDYKHLLHAHSHTAMLGWGFAAVAGALLLSFVPRSKIWPRYRWVLYLNIVATVGMLIFFIYQGYGPLSIGFSTLHIIAAYLFCFRFLQDLKGSAPSPQRFLARWSVYWLFISTLGLWSIAPVSVFLSKLHPLYFAGIQFFTHFQFNGWFTFAVLAVLAQILNRSDDPLQLRPGLKVALLLSTALTYALSITWSTPENALFYVNSAGVILQLVAFTWLFKILARRTFPTFKKGSMAAYLLQAALLCLLLKVAVQTAVAIPAIAKISYTIHNFVIGFIHLIMLGFFTLSVLAALLHFKVLPSGKWPRIAYTLLGLAFLITELILFGQGLLLWLRQGYVEHYHILIFACTLLFPLSIGLLLVTFKNYYHNHQSKA